VSTAPPIEPAPAALPSNRGCWKGTLLGCGTAAVLVVACLVGLAVYVQRRPAAVTDLLMDRIRDRYASDVTEQDKADLDAAYADFRGALEDRRVRKEDIERVKDAVKLDREVHREEVLDLTRVFREAAGGGTRDAGRGTRVAPEPTAAPIEATPRP
jgi:hypothetical protein